LGGQIWAKNKCGGLNFFGGGLKKCQRKTIQPAAEICFETNLAKNIRPSPKGLMGFISFGGNIFVWGAYAPPPKPMHGNVPGTMQSLLNFRTFIHIFHIKKSFRLI